MQHIKKHHLSEFVFVLPNCLTFPVIRQNDKPTSCFFPPALQYILFLFKASIPQQQTAGLKPATRMSQTYIFSSDLIYSPSLSVSHLMSFLLQSVDIPHQADNTWLDQQLVSTRTHNNKARSLSIISKEIKDMCQTLKIRSFYLMPVIHNQGAARSF